MKHKDIYKWFELYSGDNVAAWFPYGKNSIRIRQTNGQEFIFTYNSQKRLEVETIRSYINNSMKGGKKQMMEMISYIFGSLKASENSIKNIKTILRNQARINRKIAAFAFVTAAYAIALEVHTNKLNKKIQNLDKELKRMKGE